MADVRPIYATHYDLGVVGSLEKVAAPPYDVIDGEMRAELLARSPYNAVAIDLPKPYGESGPQDTGDDPYERAARTIEQHGRDAAIPGFGEIVSALVQRTWAGTKPADGYGQAVQESVQSIVVQRLMDLAADVQASQQVRAQATAGLRRIKAMTATITTAHATAAREDITRFLSRPADTYKKTDPLPTPPGEPIGGRGGR